MVMTSTRPRGPIQPDMIQLVRLTTIAAKTADQKPATRKPGRNQETSMIISALMTSRNNPSVSKRDGQGENDDDRAHEGVDDAEQESSGDQRSRSY